MGSEPRWRVFPGPCHIRVILVISFGFSETSLGRAACGPVPCLLQREGAGVRSGPRPPPSLVESPHPQTCCIHGAHRALVGHRSAFLRYSWFPGGAVVKSPAPQEMQVSSLGREDPN